MAVDAHANFAYSLLTNSPGTGGTSFVVTTGEGALFPAVPFNATVWPATVRPTAANAEIVRVTAISTDTFTVTRSTESSTNQNVITGYQIAATITKKTLTDVETASGIAVVDSGNYYTGTNVEAVLAELGNGTELSALPAASVPISKSDTVPIVQGGTVGQATVGGILDIINWKAPVRVATTANGTDATAFANGQTVDGVTLATNDRILRKDQTTIGENGIFIVQSSGAPVRATDFDDAVDELGACVPVTAGTLNAGTVWERTPGTTFSFTRFGANTNVQIFTTEGSNTWTKPAGAVTVQVSAIGAGGGGGAGRCRVAGSAGVGGSGGGPGGRVAYFFAASLLGATETVTVGTHGSGGAAKTGTGDGNAGTAGTASTFGSWLTAGGGTAGPAGTATDSSNNFGTAQTDYHTTGLTVFGLIILYSGYGGNSSAAASGGTGSSGIGGDLPGGGGGGGGINAASPGTEQTGGVGGSGYPVGVAGGAAGAVHANGGTATATTANGGGGGGGGGGSSNSSGTAGGSGSAGANYGSGGGGGGAGTNPGSSGAGGNGAGGIVIVRTFF